VEVGAASAKGEDIRGGLPDLGGSEGPRKEKGDVLCGGEGQPLLEKGDAPAGQLVVGWLLALLDGVVG